MFPCSVEDESELPERIYPVPGMPELVSSHRSLIICLVINSVKSLVKKVKKIRFFKDVKETWHKLVC